MSVAVFVPQTMAADYSSPFIAWPSNSGVGKSSVHIDAQMGELGLGDKGVDVTFCTPDSGMICFRASNTSFAFSIPIDVKKRTKWIYDGIKYEAEKRDLMLFGKEDLYWIIRQVDNKDLPLQFLFSGKYGLVLIQGQTCDIKGSLMLLQPCGFGAPADCGKDPVFNP
jgi:hypothetical protein